MASTNGSGKSSKEEREKYFKELAKHFPNAVEVISSGDGNKKRPTKSEIGEMLMEYDVECIHYMRLIMNHGKNWLVNFDSPYDASKFYNKQTKLKENTCYLVNPFKHDV
jgi:hypothetical protein